MEESGDPLFRLGGILKEASIYDFTVAR
jgi:hypothetical protein